MTTVRSWKLARQVAGLSVAFTAALAAQETAPPNALPNAAPSAGPAPAVQPIFADQTASLGVDFVHQNGMTGKLYFAEMAGSGSALFDADGDGDLDLYLVQGGPLERAPSSRPSGERQAAARPPSDRLYRNDLYQDAEGVTRARFVDVTAEAGLGEATGYGMGVAAGDFDNDGRIDLFLTNLGSNQLWRNVSTPDGLAFEDVTDGSGTEDPRWSVPALFADFDADGWLDLFIGNYVDFRLATHKTCSGPGGAADYCGPSSYRSEPDRLLRGLGPGADGRPRFEDVSVAAGLREPGAALGAVADDFDGDGHLDLYVTNDGMANRLYLNQPPASGGDATDSAPGDTGLRFFDDALLTGTAVNEAGQPEASMGVVAGDMDGDGSPDLFMTHLAHETNTLYLNDGSGLFHDRSRESGLGHPSWRFTGFGTALIDADLDGVRDLFVANGAVTLIEAQRTAGDPHPLKQSELFFRGLEGGQFVDATAAAGPALAIPTVSRGTSAGDLDNDGDPDLVVSINGGPPLVLVNQTDPPPKTWLGLRLVTADGKRDALGARVGVVYRGLPGRVGKEAETGVLWRRVRVDGSYGSSNDPRVLVGLGEKLGIGGVEVTRVDVRWPDGTEERFSDVEPGRYQTLRQGAGEAAEEPPAGDPP